MFLTVSILAARISILSSALLFSSPPRWLLSLRHDSTRFPVALMALVRGNKETSFLDVDVFFGDANWGLHWQQSPETG